MATVCLKLVAGRDLCEKETGSCLLFITTRQRGLCRRPAIRNKCLTWIPHNWVRLQNTLPAHWPSSGPAGTAEGCSLGTGRRGPPGLRWEPAGVQVPLVSGGLLRFIVFQEHHNSTSSFFHVFSGAFYSFIPSAPPLFLSLVFTISL